MEKNGEVRVEQTVCDLCGRKAVIIAEDGSALCRQHQNEVEAERMPAGVLLKNASASLVGRHKNGD